MMKRVVMMASRVPQMGALAVAVERMRGLGASVHMIGAFSPSVVDLSGLGLHGFTELKKMKKGAGDTVSPAQKMWRLVKRDDQAASLMQIADVLIALDPTAVYPVWEAAQMNPDAAACHGLAAGVRATEAVASSAHEETPLGLGVQSRRLKSRLVAAFGRNRSVGGGPTGQRVREIWDAAGSPVEYAPSPPSEARVAQRLRDDFDTSVKHGQVDLEVHRRAVEASLTLADKRLGKGNVQGAARELTSSMNLLFHRALHVDSVTSPMALDPGGYLELLTKSAAYERLKRGAGRERPAAQPASDRQLRLLVTTYGNANFIEPLLSRYRADPRVDLRFVDCAEDEILGPLARRVGGGAGVGARMGCEPGLVGEAEAALSSHFAWADTILIDWCTTAASLFNLVDPGETKVVLRLHSYEAFTRFPHMVDFSRVDDVIFVGPHLRDFCLAAVPQLKAANGPALHVVPNAMRLADFSRQKRGGDERFTLALVGSKAVVKDPIWAVDVLQGLRERNPRYRLILMGQIYDPTATPVGQGYVADLEDRLVSLESAGVVERLGHVDDVARELERVGVILSTSVRESFHCALVEGAASAAVPVVRNWPFFAQTFDGAHALYPADWVVESVAEAVERIIAVTEDQVRWSAEGKRAADHVIEKWDWPVVAPDFDDILLGRGEAIDLI